MCAGLAGLMSTEHTYLNQCFDVASSEYATLNHLGKPSDFQFSKNILPLDTDDEPLGSVIPDSYAVYQKDEELSVIP